MGEGPKQQRKCHGPVLSQRFPSPFLSRIVYYVGYRQVYTMEAQTVLRCCPGWSQQPGDQGCFSREYRAHPTLPPDRKSVV